MGHYRSRVKMTVQTAVTDLDLKNLLGGGARIVGLMVRHDSGAADTASANLHLASPTNAVIVDITATDGTEDSTVVWFGGGVGTASVQGGNTNVGHMGGPDGLPVSFYDGATEVHLELTCTNTDGSTIVFYTDANES